MKKNLLLVSAFCAMSVTVVHAQGLLLGWNLSGDGGSESTLSETSVADNGVLNSTLSRGSDAPGVAGSGFVTASFGDSGVPTTDSLILSDNAYFQFSVQAAPGFTLSLTSIQGLFGGGFSTSYESTSGVEMEYAYSLDGETSFTLLPSTTTTAGTSNPEWNLNVSSISALKNFDSVTFRLFSSGDTSNGVWGFENNGSNFILGSDGSEDGLIVSGTDQQEGPVPEPSTWSLIGLGLLGFGLRAVVIRHRAAASVI